MTTTKKKTRWPLVVLPVLIFILTLLLVPTARAAPDQAAPCEQGDTPTGCADIYLFPNTLIADFYMGDVLIMAGVNSGRVAVPPRTSVRIEARNISDGSEEFGDVYVYADTGVTVWVAEGQTRSYTLYPKKTYLKGFLRLTCDIRGVKAGESVACRPSIDGEVRPDILPGERVTFNLAPGGHAIHVDVVGDLAGLWHPASRDHTAKIYAGYNRYLSSTYYKKGLLTIKLNQEGVVGDLYVDGELVASQAASAYVAVEPYKSHKIEGKNFTDPAAGGVYRWKDTSVWVYMSSGQERTTTLNLKKEYLMGSLNVECAIEGASGEHDVLCNVAIDGQLYGTIAPGGQATYNLSKGTHTVEVTLSGSDMNKWETNVSHMVTITAGKTKYIVATFKKLPMLYTITLSGIGDNVRNIFQAGLKKGDNRHAFSKIGDCDTEMHTYLRGFDWGPYDLGEYGYLQEVIPYFSGSFARESIAGKGGFVVASVLDPLWADPSVCKLGETPLACEYRLNKPSFAIILLRTYPWGEDWRKTYYRDMERVVQYSIEQGVVPVISTVPHMEGGGADQINEELRWLAAAYQVPLWDLWVTTETLPQKGVDEYSHLTLPPGAATTTFTEENLRYGMTRRNLESLELLHVLLHMVIQ